MAFEGASAKELSIAKMGSDGFAPRASANTNSISRLGDFGLLSSILM